MTPEELKLANDEDAEVIAEMFSSEEPEPEEPEHDDAYYDRMEIEEALKRPDTHPSGVAMRKAVAELPGAEPTVIVKRFGVLYEELRKDSRFIEWFQKSDAQVAALVAKANTKVPMSARPVAKKKVKEDDGADWLPYPEAPDRYAVDQHGRIKGLAGRAKCKEGLLKLSYYWRPEKTGQGRRFMCFYHITLPTGRRKVPVWAVVAARLKAEQARDKE